MKDYSRADRVGDLILGELSRALLTEVSDPRLADVSLTAVKLSDCLQFARVYWLPLNADESTATRQTARTQRALERAEPFLKGHLSRALNLRYTPELRFCFDEATMHGRRVEQILSELRPEASEPSGDTPSDDAPSNDDGSDDRD